VLESENLNNLNKVIRQVLCTSWSQSVLMFKFKRCTFSRC